MSYAAYHLRLPSRLTPASAPIGLPPCLRGHQRCQSGSRWDSSLPAGFSEARKGKPFYTELCYVGQKGPKKVPANEKRVLWSHPIEFISMYQPGNGIVAWFCQPIETFLHQTGLCKCPTNFGENEKARQWENNIMMNSANRIAERYIYIYHGDNQDPLSLVLSCRTRTHPSWSQNASQRWYRDLNWRSDCSTNNGLLLISTNHNALNRIAASA